MTPAVRAAGLVVVLGRQTILHGIDLAVADGEVVALLGANGSGKSTLARALLGIVPAARGEVRLFGEPVGPRVPWGRIGYVPQRLTAAAGVPSTAVEVVTSGLLHSWHLRAPRGARRRALEALDSVDLAEVAYRPVAELSGGQQQRVLIARALVRAPDLLVLDEPTSGVDLPSQRVFAEAIARMRDRGATVVVILHEVGALAPLIQRAVVLRQGLVVHDGEPPPPSVGHDDQWHDHLHSHPGPAEAAGVPALGITS